MLRPCMFALALTGALAVSSPRAAHAQDASVSSPAQAAPVHDRDVYRRTDLLSYGVLGLGTLHLIDHGLRRDHSGFPFSFHATPTTFATFTVIPTYLFGYAYDMGPNYWILSDSLIYAGTQVAHILLEPPSHQYGTWQKSHVNALGTESPILGRLSQGVSIGLSVALVGHLASSLYDGYAHGFDWRRTSAREEDRLRVEFVPAGGGGTVQVGGVF